MKDKIRQGFVPAAALTDVIDWTKSSKSGALDTASRSARLMSPSMSATRTPRTGAIAFPRDEWTAFVSDIAAGEFTRA